MPRRSLARSGSSLLSLLSLAALATGGALLGQLPPGRPGPVVIPAGDGDEVASDEDQLPPLPAQIDDGRTPIPGSMGAIRLPVDMPYDGTLTAALFDDQGRLIRILGQLLELEQGEHALLWDGMDLWGRMLPADSSYTMRCITNPGLKAVYEMAVDQHGGLTPWGSREGEGGTMRSGGWLADHSPPNTAACAGGKVFLGSGLAEHGNSLIACTPDGEKIWGGGLAGWTGPSQLTDNGRDVIAVAKRDFYHLDSSTFQKTAFGTCPNGTPRALAAHGDQVLAYVVNQRKLLSPFRVGGVGIDFMNCVPQIKNHKPATEWHQSGHGSFQTVFTGLGKFDTGTRLEVNDAYAYLIAAFRGPVDIGTMVFERPGHCRKLEVHYLPADTAFEFERHRPGEFLPEELDEDWQLFGADEALDRRLCHITAEDEPVQAAAVIIRLWPERALLKKKQSLAKLWPRVGMAMARIHPRRITPLTDSPRRLIFDDNASHAKGSPASGGAVAWDVQQEYPISSVRPANVIIDYGKPQTFRGAVVLNNPADFIELQAWRGEGEQTPSNDRDEQWETVMTLRGQYSKNFRSITAVMRAHERYFLSYAPITTTAVRLRMHSGRLRGKHGPGMNEEEPNRNVCEEFILVNPTDRIPEEDDRNNSQIVEVWSLAKAIEAKGGRKKQEDQDDADPAAKEVPLMAEKIAGGDIAAMAFDDEGTLYTVVDGQLCRSVVEGDALVHTVLDQRVLPDPLSLAVDAEHVVVGDRELGKLLLYDKRSGELLRELGAGQRRKGPWNPDFVHKPTGVAIDGNGRIWVAENKFAPKRVARFTKDGDCDKEFFGPPMYGGGGRLDPDLKHFYHRGHEYTLDWEQGSSRLIALNDELRHQDTPTQENNSFGWTNHSEVRRVDGRRYIVGGGWIVSKKPDDRPTWTPAAVLASANRSSFLLGKDCWKEHWATQELFGKSFIWCDRNDDGAYQIDEVELIDEAGLGVENPFGGGPIGEDLTMWGRVRIRPSGYTAGGTPLYRGADIEVLNFPEVPYYDRNIAVGMLAKPAPGHAACIDPESGNRVIEGQPSIQKPDGTYVGGEPYGEPTDHVPGIFGKRIQYPMGWAGTAMTASEIGPVGIMHGNNGVWNVMSLRSNLLVGHIFTGSQGGWGGTEIVRGADVTGRKHASETFHGDFVKGHDGHYYVMGGKGFHAIARVEGLDDYRVHETRVSVPADTVPWNEKLREWLRTRPDHEGRDVGPRVVTAEPLERRTSTFVLDGHLIDWGGPKAFQDIGPIRDENRFDVAATDEGLYIAYSGWARLDNQSQDPRYLFKTGFGFEFRYDLKGGRRVVFGRHQGQWLAMMYVYQDDDVAEDDMVVFESPVVITKCARVYPLRSDQATVAFQKHDLNVSIDDLESARAAPVSGLAAAIAKVLVVPEVYRVDHGDQDKWSAEVFLSWKALGYEEKPKGMRCDFGQLSATSAGDLVDYRSLWADGKTQEVADLAVEAQINPRAFGRMTVK